MILLLALIVGWRQTGQACRRAAARRPTFLLAEEGGPKTRPWRVCRAEKPHDYASWLRRSVKAHPCTCSELAESIRPPCGHFRIHLASPKREEDQKKKQHSADALRCAFDSPARSCRQVVDGSAACGPREGSPGFGCDTGCPFSRTRPVLAHPHGFTVRATGHRAASLAHVSLRGERWGARRQASETLDQSGNSQKNDAHSVVVAMAASDYTSRPRRNSSVGRARHS